jgi:hypothetical protein
VNAGQLVVSLFGAFRELRSIATNLIPDRFRRNMDVHGDSNPWISIDRTQRDAVNLIIQYSRQS